MMNFIKPEYLVSLYLILNEQEIVTLKDLGDYAGKLNKELKENNIEAMFLYSDNYIEEMLNLYKDFFISGTYTIYDAIKRIVPNEILSEKFIAYLSNDVLKVICELHNKEKKMTTEEMIEVMKAYTEGKQNEQVDDKPDCPDDEITTTNSKEFQLRLNVISRLFNAYSKLDFNKLCDLINYTGGIKFSDTNIDNINAKDYFENLEEITVNELQDYVHTLCKACYNRWLIEHNNSKESDTEYVQNNILVFISKGGGCVGLDFFPISVVSEN